MTYTKDAIFTHVKTVLVDQFEIEADSIQPQARLHEDLDIDSIDAVDLMIELKSITGRKLALEDFQEVKTVQDVVDAAYKIAQETEAGSA